MAEHQLKTASFSPGHVLMKQGDRGQMAWLLQDGEVEVYADTESGKKSLARLSGKRVVGEMALIDNGLRTATVVVKAPVTATEIPREVFNKMLDSCEPLARHVLSHLVNAVRASRGIAITETAMAGPTIRSTEDSTRILERRVFGAGTFIFRENDPGEAAYLIQTGSVNIMKDTRMIASLGPGRTFGEMALLRNTRRMASAMVGETGAAVEIIRRREFDKAINSMPKILQALTQAYLGYLIEPAGK
jgi:CRP-like cAMP-binding protein